MNDTPERDLERARAAIDALAQHVDTASAWGAVEGALDRGARRSGRRSAQLAVALVTVVAVIGAVAYAHRSDSGKTTLEVTPGHDHPALDCVLPSLPVPGAKSSDPDPLGLDLHLSGPAVASLRGGAALAPFALDGGRFRVTPPLAGDTPSVTANQAQCAALATSNANGWPLLDLARDYGGAAVGFGRVTVDPTVKAQPNTVFAGQLNDNTKPTLPAPAAYRDRLAWLVVVKNVVVFHGGGSFRPVTTTTSPAPPSNRYDVFLIDAQSGSDALLYTESQLPSIETSVMVPAERVSVPWKLVSRAPDRFHAEIKATVLPCDGYPNPVAIDSQRAALAVVVDRPVNASCGAPEEVTIPLGPATVTADLPDHIDHDPLGPYVTIANPAAVAPTGDRVLKQLTEQDNGTTIRITVGSVLAISPLHDGGQYAALPVTSSDPSVLGVLLADEVHEFRAWKPGTADLTEPPTTCNAPGKGQPCTGPWVVHVIIR